MTVRNIDTYRVFNHTVKIYNDNIGEIINVDDRLITIVKVIPRKYQDCSPCCFNVSTGNCSISTICKCIDLWRSPKIYFRYIRSLILISKMRTFYACRNKMPIRRI